jgi:hypothetical protein
MGTTLLPNILTILHLPEIFQPHPGGGGGSVPKLFDIRNPPPMRNRRIFGVDTNLMQVRTIQGQLWWDGPYGKTELCIQKGFPNREEELFRGKQGLL